MGADAIRLATARRIARRTLDSTQTAVRRATYRPRDIAFRNREGLADYDFVLPARRADAGVSAMLRVRNESRKIELCLASILPLFDEIVVVDNGSTDDTVRLVERFKEAHDRDDRIRLFEYPHTVAACGDPHSATAEDSVHSLAYFYNWCLSHCTRAYYFKWDGDMVVVNGRRDELRDFFISIRDDKPALWRFAVQTIYRAADGAWYRAIGEVNTEVRLAPNRSAVRYVKGLHWELLHLDVPFPRRDFDPVSIYEMKDVAEAEFDHWVIDAFPPGGRKEREWLNFQAIKNGPIDQAQFEAISADFAEVG